MDWRIEMVKHPVLPVPDCAYQLHYLIAKTYLRNGVLSLDDGKDTFLLDRRRLDETVPKDSS